MVPRLRKAARAENFPEKGAGTDRAIAAARFLASAVPVFGGPATELIGLVGTPLQARQVAWMNDLANRVKALEKSGGASMEELVNDPEFLTLLTRATQAAVVNHEKEKLEAIKNVVLSAARRETVEEGLRIIFLSHIDQLSPWHLRLLTYLQNPEAACRQKGVNTTKYVMGGAVSYVEEVYPELRGRREFVDLLFNDLKNRGLVTGSLQGTTSGAGMLQNRTTGLGDRFLSMIGLHKP